MITTKISMFFLMTSFMMELSMAQGPRKFHGSSTTTKAPQKQFNAIRALKSKCQLCLTIKTELKGEEFLDSDICDESARLRFNAEGCEDILNDVISQKRKLDSYCNFICNKHLPSRKVIRKRSINLNEIE